ncbi:alpha/beta fold hydrolase [Phenylobacterium sp.]|jgi:pimeloyl-ACP methyl ester carboxylesterase|uniref:alpha/beta fold hydrolase n=1 Tax=Phenylobacterium sp. TaxID=1871053 RepID=UPI002F935F95
MRAAVNGLELEYEVFGEPGRPTIILIMGYASQLTRWPVELCQALATRDFFVVRYDNRDVGRSTSMDHLGDPDLAAVMGGAAPPYTLADMADDAVALLDHLGVQKAHIVGASMGGMIAQLVAVNHPERTLSLTSIMSTTGNPALPRPKDEVTAVLSIVPPPDDLPGIVDRGVRLARLIGSPGYPEGDDAVRERLLRDAERGYNPRGMVRHMAAIVADGDRRDRLARITAPTVVLHGLDDALVPVEGGRDTAKHIPSAKLIEVPGMGHDFPVQLVDVFADAICAAASGAAEQ